MGAFSQCCLNLPALITAGFQSRSVLSAQEAPGNVYVCEGAVLVVTMTSSCYWNIGGRGQGC